MTPGSSAESRLAERLAVAPADASVTAFVVVDGGLLAGCPLAPFLPPP
jgi:putative phosphoserine phosphatase / 1-acylglycerol-3-phosphate O-acyltransferase